MKKIILLFLFFPFICLSQELTLNADTNIYEHSYVKENPVSISEKLASLETKLKQLNFSNIELSQNSIKGENFYSKLIMGTTMQVKYQVIIDLKENKYKVLINKFIIDDKRWSPIPLENLKGNTKRWVKDINEQLPSIIKAIESKDKDW